MKIKILGNGGAINDGLPYNSFLVNDEYLIETPPDIMNSLFRENIDISKIRMVYVSHFHGDHFLGLPMLAVRLYFNSRKERIENRITIAGPEGIENKSRELFRLAFSENHPINKWILDSADFIELSSDECFNIGKDLELKPFRMYHSVETWGFSLHEKGGLIFSYFADTLWDDKLFEQVLLFPKAIITDMSGEPSDPDKIHLSENDIISKVLPVSGERIIFYGTHTKYQKESSNLHIRYTRPGDEIFL